MSKQPELTSVRVSEQPATRAGFLRKAGLGGATLLGGGALLARATAEMRKV